MSRVKVRAHPRKIGKKKVMVRRHYRKIKRNLASYHRDPEEIDFLKELAKAEKKKGRRVRIVNDLDLDEDFIEIPLVNASLSKKKESIRKNYGSKVIETPEMKRLRERRGFDAIVEIDAEEFAHRFKRDQGADLSWSSERLKSARERDTVDSYPQVTVSEHTGRVDVNDGRHRLAVAAERGEKIKVAVKGEQENRLLNALKPRPILTFDEPTDGVRHANDAERVARRQNIANELMSRGWSLIDAAQESFDIEDKEEKERSAK